ncbi:septum formation family protein [Tamaricihabitans halophyticus]|nr:septum formation family protein [Tamaricihabitans halophyticus]
MTGAFVGALVVLGLSLTFSWPAQVQNPIAVVDEETKRAEEAFNSPAGTCVTWTKGDSSDMRKVKCAQPHLFEMVGSVNIASDFGPQAPPPTTKQWRELTEQSCGKLAEEQLGKKLDPEGKLSLGTLRPSEDQWRDGDRKLRCGLQYATPGGQLQELEGPAAEQEQSDIYEVGTCLALDGKTVGDPVACDKAHAYEMIGIIDLGHEFSDGYPSVDDQNTYLDTTCSEEVDRYSGGKSLKDNGLVVSWDTRSQESWDAGSKLVNCKIAADPKDGDSLAPVTGSFAKEPEPSESGKPEESTESSEKPGDGN